MEKEFLHNNSGKQMPNLDGQIKIPSWKKSKEEVWDEMLPLLKETNQTKTAKVIPLRTYFAMAAAIVILIGIPLFMRNYSQTQTAMSGQHAQVTLPDGSKVKLNASSEISYKPFWWRFNREVELRGEAFFEVEKGERFDVVSENAITSVLGTSFNIYARENHYRVSCLTGKVKVIGMKTKSEVILASSEIANLNVNGKIEKQMAKDVNNSVSWLNNRFVYTAVPLRLVFEEIERQYNIKIEGKDTLDHLYTGNFKKEKPVENVLNFVGRPFDINFVKKSQREYQVFNKNKQP